MRRYVDVTGLDDGLRLDLGSNYSMIVEIGKIGQSYEYGLVHEADMTGTQLLELMEQCCVDAQHREKIKAENRYRVVAYDW